MPDHEYLFDVKLFASVRVMASSEAAARKLLDEMDPVDDMLLFGASIDGEADLIEIDGEAV